MTDSNTATIPAIVRERVARGLAWIIGHGAAHGVNLDRVDLGTLDVGLPDFCVLGQAHGGVGAWSGYRAVMESVWPGWLDDDCTDGDNWAVDHGFAPDYGHEPEITGAMLTEAWRQAITVHRAGQ